jgi:hypothetical protein
VHTCLSGVANWLVSYTGAEGAVQAGRHRRLHHQGDTCAAHPLPSWRESLESAAHAALAWSTSASSRVLLLPGAQPPAPATTASSRFLLPAALPDRGPAACDQEPAAGAAHPAPRHHLGVPGRRRRLRPQQFSTRTHCGGRWLLTIMGTSHSGEQPSSPTIGFGHYFVPWQSIGISSRCSIGSKSMADGDSCKTRHIQIRVQC